MICSRKLLLLPWKLSSGTTAIRLGQRLLSKSTVVFLLTNLKLSNFQLRYYNRDYTCRDSKRLLMTNQIGSETLKQFREELYAEGILHDGDTIGTSDDTLVYVNDESRSRLFEPSWRTSYIISGGFYGRVDLTWSKPRKCLETASNGVRS